MRIKLLVGILATQATRHSVLPSHGLERQCEHDTYCLILFLVRLYPVDMKRVNEFGVSYEDQEKDDKPHKD